MRRGATTLRAIRAYIPPMQSERFGEYLSLGAAMAWSSGLILFKLSSEELSALSLNIFKNLIAITLFAITVAVQPAALESLAQTSVRDLAVLALSGVLGIAIADTLFFFAMSRLGVGLAAIVDCVYSPAVVFFGWILLGESLRAHEYVGGAMILSAVLVATGQAPSVSLTRRDLLIGAGAAILGVSLMAYGIVLATPILRTGDITVAAFVRLFAGTVFLILAAPMAGRSNDLVRAITPSRIWRFGIPAATIGTYICLMCWIGGFKYAKSGVAALLNQTSVIFSLLMAAIFLREKLTGRKIAAVAMAISGVLVMQLWPQVSG